MPEVLARICVFCSPEIQSQGCEQATQAAIQTLNCHPDFTFEVTSDPFDLVIITVKTHDPDAAFHGMPLLNALQRLGLVVFRPEATGQWQVHNL